VTGAALIILLWIGTVVDILLFVVGLFIALEGAATAGISGQPTSMKLLLLAVYGAVPVISLLGVSKAWNLYGRGRHRHAATWVFAPVIYVTAGAAVTFFRL
jgi:hypothetical protein